jgi:sugar phosphate isomerase/epimerase
MDVGVFAKVYNRSSVGSVLDAIRTDGMRYVQFNMSCAGLPTLPDVISTEISNSIRDAFSTRNIVLSAMSGTFNIINPDLDRRRLDLQRLRVLALACPGMEVPMITLCTGTRDATNMWKAHPENNSKDAWRDMLFAMQDMLEATEDTSVLLGIEPELSNVVNTASKARLLLDTMQSPRLRIVMDGSNLLRYEEVRQMGAVFQQAFDLLGASIQLVHAKDLLPDGGHGAAGTGSLDYDLYISLLQKVGYCGPLILHTLTEDQVPDSVRFLRSKLTCQHQNATA